MGKLFSKSNNSNKSSNKRKSDDNYDLSHRQRNSNEKAVTHLPPKMSNNTNKLVLKNSFSNNYEDILYVNTASGNQCIFGNNANHDLILFDYDKKKEIKRWKGHDADISKTLYCKKIDAYLSASRDKSVRLWKTTQDSCTLNMSGHTLIVSGIAVNQDNTFMVSGSRDNNLNLWDLQTGKLLLTSHISRNLVTDLQWSSNGKIIIQSSEDKEIRLWDPMSLKILFSFPKKNYIQASVHISSDCNYALSTSNGFQGNGCEISIWDLRKNTLLQEMYGHEQTVSCARFIQSDKYIASSSHDSTVRLWDTSTYKTIESIHVGGTLTSLNESLNGYLLVSSLNGINLFDKPL